MNRVWDDMGLDNIEYTSDELGKYYSHPVWFLNGLFIESDEESMSHRKSVAGYFTSKKSLKILDYGGGFGTLAKEISAQTPSSQIDIYEPYVSKFAFENIKNFYNINIINFLKENYYDVLVNTDVLEHVEDPISLISIYNNCLKDGGHLISHWDFAPCIKCHLPKHFHFKYTFEKIIPLLDFSNELKNNRHGHFFRKQRNVSTKDLNKAYQKEKISKLLYPLNKIIEEIKKIVVIVLKKLAMYDLMKRVVRR